MQTLTATTLAQARPSLATPGYDRSALNIGIVHFGVGGFHRAHQAMFLDRLMNEGKALDWAICGVGVLPGDERMRDVLRDQDCLYTLVTKHANGEREGRVIGSMAEYLYAPDDPETVIEKMASEQVRIVSLTITEGGYNINHMTGQFDTENRDVMADLRPEATPKTIFGLVTEALSRRRARGIKPFTVMSCDNIRGNGEVARRTLSTFASLRDAGLGEWIERNVSFPNSMVDRITPATTDDDSAVIAEEFGVGDGWPVVSEPFVQWVLEDKFGLGRPPLEEAGVQIVNDVEPYELMKLRLLNAGHQSLCYFGYLAGYRYAHEVCQDPLFASFLLEYMSHEAQPTLAPVPGVDLEEYKRNLIERFSNPHIHDTLVRLCAESSDRIPNMLIPVIGCNLQNDGEISRSAGVVASWARYAEGTDEEGAPIEVVDRLAEPLMAAAARQREDPLAFIANREVFGDLIDNERFVTAYAEALSNLHQRGARAAVEALVG